MDVSSWFDWSAHRPRLARHVGSKATRPAPAHAHCSPPHCVLLLGDGVSARSATSLTWRASLAVHQRGGEQRVESWRRVWQARVPVLRWRCGATRIGCGSSRVQR